MKRLLFTLILITTLWFNFTPTASAFYDNLTPCSDSAAYQQKSKHFLNTTDDPKSGQKRAELYAEALCGADGYPHLVVDGNLAPVAVDDPVGTIAEGSPVQTIDVLNNDSDPDGDPITLDSINGITIDGVPVNPTDIPNYATIDNGQIKFDPMI